MTAQSKIYDEIIDFIAIGIPSDKFMNFKPSSDTMDRVQLLLSKEKNDVITALEKKELDHYFLLEHLMRLAKAKAIKNGQA